MSIRFTPSIGALTIAGLLATIPTLSAAQTAADNTKRNRPAGSQAVTAQEQKETPADRDITQKIRRAIVADKSLSTYAHNVKIITRDGSVTLKGPVRSTEEKDTVLAKAATIVDKAKIANEITIAPPKK